ncbi:glycosyltransferase family 2 protein [Ferruginibacter yonginensis]|uniref:Glycosyltransferase family 2 protein n=1 Tax=Ferruginibacter yonginensis TaxID=1310416 RepID=A0ABV8QNA6_9BACT
MELPLVSVLMTAYNRAAYIGAAIKSVQASSYTHWELIITDDCSTDGTVAICEQFAAADARIKLYRNPHNLGDYGNRNRAASLATGIYLKYVDADDMIYPHTIAAMVQAMEQHPSAAYGFSYFGPPNDAIHFPRLFTPQVAYQTHFLVQSFFYAGPGGAIIRKAAFDAVGGFSGKRYVGDTELWLRLSAQYDCVQFWPALLWWRQHDAQENKYEQQDYQALVSRHLLVMDALSQAQVPLDAAAIAKAKRNFIRIYCHKIIRFMLTGNFTAVGILLKGYKVSALQLIQSLLPVNKLQRLIGKGQ